MGFLFGSPSHQTSSSNSTSSSSNLSGNLAFPYLLQSSPALGNAGQASSMMASLLGLPSAPAPTPTPTPTPSPNPYPNPYGGGDYPYPTQSGGNNGGSYPYPIYGGRQYSGRNFNLGDGIDGASFNMAANPAYAVNQNPGAPTNTTNILGTQSNPVSTPAAIGTPANPISAADSGSALENFSNSAGMNFLRDQGVKAIDASQAGKGVLQSGATGQALTEFGQNLGNTYLNNYLTHLNDYANIGSKNNAILGSTGTVSTGQSQGMLSSSGSGTGGKQGLLQSLVGPGLGSIIAGLA